MQPLYRRLSISLCLLLLFMLYPPQTAYAATITVTGACTLVDAITAANTDTATGSCPAGGGADTIDLTGNVTLTAIVDTTEGDSGLPSISSDITINGNGFTISRSGATLFRLIHISASGNLNLSNVTLDNGNLGFAVASTDGEGGAVFSRGILNLNLTQISNNRAFRGGGLANYGSLSVTDSSVFNNTGGIRAGGIWNTTTATITNTIIMNNAVNSGFGGGIRNFSGTMTITNSLIMNNMADSGQGISNETGATLIVRNSTISNNTGLGSGGGGGLHNLGTASIESSTISSNAVSGVGGGGIYNAGDLSLSNSTISGNSSISVGGGGIRNNTPGTLSLTNSTISNNSSDSQGGGIITDFSGSGTVTANNTIIANNSAPSFSNCSAFPGDIVGSNNLSSDTSCDGFGNITPGTDYSTALQYNGGFTDTHALLPSAGNPAIDTGGACGLTTDQRAFNRDASCDVGAYELIQPSFLFTLNASSVTEGGTASPQVELQLAQNAPITGIFTVDVSYTDVTATTGLDYAPDVRATFDCSATCMSNMITNLSIPTVDDALLENPETVNLSLTNPIVGLIGTFASHTLTINDNDTAVASIAAAGDGAEPATNGQFTVSLTATNESGSPITITYSIAGTATSGSDYTTLSGSVAIPNGANSATINVSVLDDAFAETVETVTLTLTGASNANVTTDTTPATVNILDDELAGVTINPTALGIVEGGTGNYTIVLDTEPSPGEIVTVTVAISGAAASEIASTSALSFNFDNTNWDTPQPFNITLNDDLISNGNRAYLAAFSHSSDSNSATSGYDAAAGLAINSVDLNIIDNESPNVVINPTAFTLIVGNIRTYDVFLTVEPSANVTISLTQLDANCTISAASLTFTNSAGANPWNVPQQITVTGVGVAGAICTVQHSPTGGGYTGVVASDVVVTLRRGHVPANPSSPNPEPGFTLTDPAISKIGLLLPGETGVLGEQIEWFITVTNGAVPQAITITDTLIPALQIDEVKAVNASHSISAQTVTVTTSFLNAGQSYTYSIVTTVLSGATVNNTACIANTPICDTGQLVSQLPSTGENPFWRLPLLFLTVLLGVAGSLYLRHRTI